MKNILRSIVFSLLTMHFSFSFAQFNIETASDTQILQAGAAMASALAKSAPVQIDRATVLRGGIFYPDTKTLIYQYDISTNLAAGMGDRIKLSMCGDPMKKSFMRRGIKYRHDYYTPSGLKTFIVAIDNCA